MTALMVTCVSCGASIPSVVSMCRECGRETEQVSYPDDSNWWTDETIERYVSQAESDTVTRERLAARKTGFLSRLFASDELQKRRSHNRPIVGYLNPSESPHYILRADGYVIIRDRAESRYLRDEQSIYPMMAEQGYCPLIVVTDERVLIILGDETGDILASAPIRRIVDIEAHVSPPAHEEWAVSQAGGIETDADLVFKLKFTTTTSKFEIYLDPSTQDSTVNSIVRFIEDLAVTSDQTPLHGRQQYTGPNSTSDDENAGEQSNFSQYVVGRSALKDIRSYRNQVDWEESIQTGFRVGSQALQYSILTPYSTPLIVGACTLGGTALKAHCQISGDSLSIDPDELLDRGIAGADLGGNFDLGGINPDRVGATVGTSRYLAERITPERYKHFVERTNPKTIMKGAERGIAFGKRSETPLSPQQAAIAGACCGLLYSYVPNDSALRDVDPDGLFDNDDFLGTLSS